MPSSIHGSIPNPTLNHAAGEPSLLFPDPPPHFRNSSELRPGRVVPHPSRRRSFAPIRATTGSRAKRPSAHTVGRWDGGHRGGAAGDSLLLKMLLKMFLRGGQACPWRSWASCSVSSSTSSLCQSRNGVSVEAAHPDGAGSRRGAGPREGPVASGRDAEEDLRHKRWASTSTSSYSIAVVALVEAAVATGIVFVCGVDGPFWLPASWSTFLFPSLMESLASHVKPTAMLFPWIHSPLSRRMDSQ